MSTSLFDNIARICKIGTPVAAIASLLALAACAASSDGSESTPTETTESTHQAVTSGWTSPMSENDPPIICDGTALVSTFNANGDYSSAIQFYCQPTGINHLSSYWTDYHSEQSPSVNVCNAGYWVTGASCRGNYCSKISLQCTYLDGNRYGSNCYWTGWVSNNDPPLSFGGGYYARGIDCSGDYCSRQRFYVCQP